ncbi:MAG: tRNA 2-selenouridine(34) synthase MnmH [Rhodobacteraceae bacterium]|nr:tRNA 2-selenouridine(34) synthase MnmH [Paracoccaceae bacterium]
MAQTFDTLNALLNHGFDTVIDVRSPAEFAEDHIPGAINLPVLSNQERADVGTTYKQQSPFMGRKTGAALVFRNAADHIAGPLRDRDGAWRPLVYCWRGGQRSGAFSWMLGQIGWRADVIAGGYKTYRCLVNTLLYDGVIPHRVVLLDGYTGTAKTEILHHLATLGVQVLDLEGAAGHRGSLLGGLGEQPSQKMFESRLAAVLHGLDPSRPVVVEAESSKIGDRLIPPALWEVMKTAPRIEIAAPIEDRTAYLVEAYADVLADAERLRTALAPLHKFRGHDVIDGWFEQIAQGDLPGLTRALMVQHYDPAYAKSRSISGQQPARIVQADSLDATGIKRVATKVAQALQDTVI